MAEFISKLNPNARPGSVLYPRSSLGYNTKRAEMILRDGHQGFASSFFG
jgi:hypothetical protein